MEFDPNIRAELVYDGTNVRVPSSMGTPKTEQLQGTMLEVLTELCGRICYDSLGTGRSSEAFHQHLLEVKHWSVYEHAHFTVKIKSLRGNLNNLLEIFVNWNDVYIIDDGEDYRLTFNLRHLLDMFLMAKNNDLSVLEEDVMFCMASAVKKYVPRLIEPTKHAEFAVSWEVAEPSYEKEKFVTLMLCGSRGMSHEQVRHRFNMSQRSTRFCDETQSPWVQHPLATMFMHDEKAPIIKLPSMKVTHMIQEAQRVYEVMVDTFEKYLILTGKADKLGARKQARGAARGYLGNALYTEMMFTASIHNWKIMLKQRCSQFADGEIRLLYNSVLTELKKSQYADCFNGWNLVPSPDGIGSVLAIDA